MTTRAPSHALFIASSEFLTSAPSAASLSTASKLRLYALYKICTAAGLAPKGGRPGFWDPTGRAKWDAWDAAGKDYAPGTEGDVAKARGEYVGTVRGLGWDVQEKDLEGKIQEDEVDLENLSDDEDDAPTAQASGGMSSGMGVRISSLAGNVDDTAEVNTSNDDEDLPPYSFIISPSASSLITYLESHPESVNSYDRYGLTPLHLAADRNHPELVKILLEHGADKEAKDREDGMTAREMVAPLGKGYEEVLKLLNG